MRNNIYIIAIFIISSLLGCSDFDKLNIDPNKPADATADLLVTGMLENFKSGIDAKTYASNFLITKHLAWSEMVQDQQYCSFGTAGFDYNKLRNIKIMQDNYYTSLSDSSAYEAFGLFLKAYKAYYLTLKVGDIPYKEALDRDNLKPKYDTQKEVFISILRDLDEAYKNFDKANQELGGDFMYKGDVKKWAKMVNVFELRVLINLSKKIEDRDLNVIQKFKEVASRKLFTSIDDNFQLNFQDKAGMVYRFHSTETKHAGYAMLTSDIVDSLKAYNDYRLFYYGHPALGKIADLEGDALDRSFQDPDNYLGVDPTLDFSAVKTVAGSNMYSALNKRYTDNPDGEPIVYVGYQDLQFVLAEAALRGWIDGSADKYYKEGVKASLEFVRNVTPSSIKIGRLITDDYISAHLSSTKLQLTGDFETDLNKIITQKFLSSFLQYRLEPYFDYRRTGFPKYKINPKTSMNDDGYKDRIPVRFRYPLNEADKNSENYTDAVNHQFGPYNDRVNELMWLLKD